MRFFILILLLFTTLSSLVMAEKDSDSTLTLKSNVPYREDSGLSFAEYYIATQKYAQAIEAANAVLKRHAESADAYVYRGLARQALEDPKGAETDFRRALALNPKHLGANRYLAGIYLANGDLPRAVEQMLAIRTICGISGCAELDDLQAAINAYKSKKSKKED